MRTRRNRAGFLITVTGSCFLVAYAVKAVEDGLGTNYLGVVSAASIELDGEVRISWPAETGSVGGTLDFRAMSNRVVWGSIFPWDGQLETVRLQTDAGDADTQIVRSKWNDEWGNYTVINDLKATSDGVSTSVWISSWVSNSYRIGVIVTNFSTGTNLWWSIDYTR